MTVKRALWWGFWIFVLFFVVTDPVSASDTTEGLVADLEWAAGQASVFLQSLFGP